MTLDPFGNLWWINQRIEDIDYTKQYYAPVKESFSLNKIAVFTSQTGELIDSSHFLDDGMFSINGDGSIANVTLKDGEHYKITVLELGKCGSNAKLDSLKKYFSDDPPEPDVPSPDDN